MKIKPLAFWPSLLYFSIPALAFILSIYILLPYMVRMGATEYVSYCVALMLPLIAMLAASFAGLYLEGRSITLAGLKERFRLKRMGKADWAWTFGSLVVMLLLMTLFGGVSLLLANQPFFPLPENIPSLLDPRIPADQIITTFKLAMGPSAQGNWGLVILMVVLLFFNVIGEEFWWRGLILPRQELVHGKWTWVIHGTLWALFHAFKYWQWITLLPVTLIISYVAQRQKNTWPGIITHSVINGLGLFPIILIVMDKI